MERERLIEALNGDLAREYAAVIQYIHYSAKVRGPWRSELRTFFQAEIADEQLHCQYLADKIAAMGGEPVTLPATVAEATSAKEMLLAVRDAELSALRNYTVRIGQAEALGEIALKVQLENFVNDEQNHLQEVEQMLADWE